MFLRTFAVAMNTYREAVRARVLFGLLALALATSVYSLVIAAMSITQEMRIVADIGTASMSLYAVLVAVVLGATSLYRELELKTVFPILTRQLRRHEYVVGKFLGIWATLLAFAAIDGAAILLILAFQSKAHLSLTIAAAVGMLVILAVALWRAKLTRVFVVLPWSIAFFVVAALLADGAGAERKLVLFSTVLALGEVAIITAVAMLFSSFSSPYLTAIFTFMVFVIGRSSDSLGNLPARYFGSTIRSIGIVLARVVPNLDKYVPERALLLGQVGGEVPMAHVLRAWLNAGCYACLLLALSAVVFRKRDFQ